MSDERKQQNQQGGQGHQQSGAQGAGQQQQRGGGGQKSKQQRQQPSLKPVQGGQQHGGGGHMARRDQISFYDESLKKQIEGSFKTDGKSIHVSSAYGVKSFPYNDLGASIDHDAQVLLVQKVLSELARDPGSGKFKDLQQQKGDQQPQGIGSTSAWGGGNGPGANP
jgi:hypothetical protein